MKKLFPAMIFFACTAGGALAQPVFTSANYSNVIGMSYTQNTGGEIEAGAAGANQTWDFSEVESDGESTVTLVAPSATPDGNLFPTATFSAVMEDVVSYYRVDNAGLYTVGMSTEETGAVAYTDERTELKFPFTNGSAYSDQSLFVINSNGFEMSTSGDLTVTVDGYGSVITPDGTFNNVLRMHGVETVEMTMFISEGLEITTTAQTDSYFWMAEGIPMPVFSVVSFVMEGDEPEVTFSYLSDITSSIDQRILTGTSVYPNPAVDVLNIDLGSNAAGEMLVDIIDAKGALVAQKQAPANRLTAMNIGGLESGVYFVRIKTDDGTAIQKFVK